jgi:chromosome segregation ATPase
MERLRSTLSENEEFCETIQQAHDALTIRCTELENERTEMLHLRSADSQTLVEVQDELMDSEKVVKDLRMKHDRAQETIGRLQDTVRVVEERLRESEEMFTNTTTEYGNQVADLQNKLAEGSELSDTLGREKRVLQEEIGEKEAELRSADEDLRLAREEVSASRSLVTRTEEVIMEKDKEIAQLRIRLQEMEVSQLVDESQTSVDAVQVESLENTIAEMEKELETKNAVVEALTSENDKIRIESYNRIRQLEGSARETAIRLSKQDVQLSKSQAELAKRQDDMQTITAEMERSKSADMTSSTDLKNALRQLSAKESIINVLREKVRTVGFAGDEKFAMAQTEVQALKVEVESLTRRYAEAEVGLRESGEGMAKLEEERRRWEEERTEVS